MLIFLFSLLFMLCVVCKDSVYCVHNKFKLGMLCLSSIFIFVFFSSARLCFYWLLLLSKHSYACTGQFEDAYSFRLNNSISNSIQLLSSQIEYNNIGVFSSYSFAGLRLFQSLSYRFMRLEYINSILCSLWALRVQSNQ